MKGKRLISVVAALALGTQPAMALTHSAARGDSYWTVAQRYGVDFGELLRLNGADESSRLDVGDRVLLPDTVGSHTVQNGDTYWLISQRYGVELGALLRANGANEGSVLNIGDRVIIPSASSPAPEPQTPEPPEQGGGPYITYTTYTVKSGDTLWNIAIECGIPFDELLRENGLNENSTVRDGTVLRVPVHNVPVKPAPEGYGELLDWWTEAQYVVPIGAVFTVTDLATGKSFTAKRTIGSNHADCETLTAADTARLKEIWGGSFNWGKRAVIVTHKGRKIAASAAGMFHAGNEWAPGGAWTDWRSDNYGPGINYDYVKGNDASGHFDIHFYGSTRHNNGALDNGHQANVLKAAGR